MAQIILKLALARVAPADADALAGRRRIDLEPGRRRKLGQRIAVRTVNEVRAAIEGTPKLRVLGETAAADLVRRLDQVKLRPAADSRRAAAIPAAPAPTMMHSTSPRARRLA